MSIGNKIRNRRIELNMTQEDLALKVGYTSKSTINKIELGINDIPLSKVREFARALSTTEAYLMDWEDETSSSGTTSSDAIRPAADPGEEHLISVYRDLNPDGREKLLDYADDLNASGRYKKYDPLSEAVG